jgi:uncharacterized phage-associated protein
MTTTRVKNDLDPQEKMAELIKACIFYGAANEDGKITKTKLAKLVYLADFAYYYKYLKPITGVRYQKLDHGPVSPDYFDQLINLLGTEQIVMEKKDTAQLFSLKLKKNKINLPKSQLKLVKEICSKWKEKNTREIVNFTHDQLPWKISFENDEIPYSLILQEDEASLY